MDLFRVYLSQWTTLWIEFNCRKAAVSKWGLTFNYQVLKYPWYSLDLPLKDERMQFFQPPYGTEPGISVSVSLYPNYYAIALHQTVRSHELYWPWTCYHSFWIIRSKTRQYGSEKKSFSRFVGNVKREVD